jgi:hypothetical protein
MHQQPPKTPLLRSTSSANAAQVVRSSGRVVRGIGRVRLVWSNHVTARLSLSNPLKDVRHAQRRSGSGEDGTDPRGDGESQAEVQPHAERRARPLSVPHRGHGWPGAAKSPANSTDSTSCATCGSRIRRAVDFPTPLAPGTSRSMRRRIWQWPRTSIAVAQRLRSWPRSAPPFHVFLDGETTCSVKLHT